MFFGESEFNTFKSFCYTFFRIWFQDKKKIEKLNINCIHFKMFIKHFQKCLFFIFRKKEQKKAENNVSLANLFYVTLFFAQRFLVKLCQTHSS